MFLLLKYLTLDYKGIWRWVYNITVEVVLYPQHVKRRITDKEKDRNKLAFYENLIFR